MKQLKKMLIVLFILCLSVFYGDHAYAHARHPRLSPREALPAMALARGMHAKVDYKNLGALSALRIKFATSRTFFSFYQFPNLNA